MTRPRPLVPLVSLAFGATLVLSACDSGGSPEWDPGEPGVERSESDGVEVVMNRGPDRPLGWHAEEVLRLGGPDAEGPEAFHRVTSNNLATDSEGNVYLIGLSDLAIQVFDRDGRHLRSFAGSGEGPGELRFSYRIMIGPDGTLRVIDSMSQRIERFDLEGTYLGGTEIPSPACCGMAVMTPAGMVGIWFDERMYDSSGDPEVRRAIATGEIGQVTQLVLVPLEGESWGERRVLAELESPTTSLAEYPGCPDPPALAVPAGVTVPASRAPPPVFARTSISWAAGRGQVGYSAEAEYEFNVVDPIGRPRMSVRRERPPVHVTRELAAAEIGPRSVPGLDPDEPCEVSAEDWAEVTGWSEEITWITDLSLTPGGRWFVQRREPGKEPARRIDVFEADGEYLGTLPPDFPWPSAWRGEDEFVRMETDDFDVPHLVAYRIVEAPAAGG